MILSGRVSLILIVALVVSVCLNLFGAGLIAGDVVQRRGAPDGRPPAGVAPIAEGFVRAALDVPPLVRPYVREHVERQAAPLMAELRNLHQARRGVARALSAEPFDRPAMEAAFAQVRTTTDRSQVLLHQALVAAIETMPADARQAWAESWRSREPRMPRGDGPRDGPGREGPGPEGRPPFER